MIKNRKLYAGLFSLAFGLGLVAPAAMARDVYDVVTIDGRTDRVTYYNLDAGDKVNLTVVNKTDHTLVFHPNQQALFQQALQMLPNRQAQSDVRWSIAPNSTQVISYTVPQETALLEFGVNYDKQNVAYGDTRYKTVTLSPGAGQISFDDVNVGDKVQLTLINPTDTPVTFTSNDPVWGTETSMVVPPHSQQIVTLDYQNPVSGDVQYLVTAPGGEQLPVATVVQPTVSQVTTTTSTSTTGTSAVQEAPEITPVAPAPSGSGAVRGFW